MARASRKRREDSHSLGVPAWEHSDLLLSIGLTALTAVLVITFPDWRSPMRTFLGFTVVLLFPGYVLQVLLFPKKGDVDGVERLALTLGLSIVLIPFVGLMLNYTPWGIRLTPTAIGLTLAVTLLGAAGYGRRQTLSSGEAFFLDPRLPAVRKGMLLFALVVAVGGAVPSLAVVLRPAPNDTAFYVLGKNGRLENYPRTLTPGERFQLTLGITNRSAASQTYTIRFPFEKKYDHLLVPMLKPGATWQVPVSLTAPPGNGKTELDFDLYRSDTSRLYRHLRLFVQIQPQARASGPGTSATEAPPGIANEGSAQQPSSSPGTSSNSSLAFRTYLVQPGDTMYEIAQRFYGNGNQYPRIVAANRDRLKNYRKLPVGLTLRIPPP